MLLAHQTGERPAMPSSLKLTPREIDEVARTEQRLLEHDPMMHLVYRLLMQEVRHRHLVSGLRLPFHSIPELMAFCLLHQVPEEALVQLYRVGLLSKPKPDTWTPAILRVAPGYDGPLTALRHDLWCPFLILRGARP